MGNWLFLAGWKKERAQPDVYKVINAGEQHTTEIELNKERAEIPQKKKIIN